MSELGKVCHHGCLARSCNTCELESELSRLKAENERLRVEMEVLIWNLAGCSTFALGYGINEPFDTTKASPAMFDVLKVRKQLNVAEEALGKIASKGKAVSHTEPYEFDPKPHDFRAIAEDALAKIKEMRQ